MLQNLLSEEQQKIINHIDGSILVLAPAGTGKTLVLSQRIIQAIKSGIPAEKILCLTFTNRAAKEMSDRLAKALPDQYRRLTIKTFHGFCSSVLQRSAREIGLPADFVVFDDIDCKEIIKEVSHYLNYQDLEKLFLNISNCKSKANITDLSLIYPEEKIYTSLGVNTARLAVSYQEILQQRHALDFADLVFYVRAIFHHKPELKKLWQERFDLIQVDEVQDTHLSEYEIVRELGLRCGNLAMIGDLDQTIYEWRGSEPDQVIKHFKKDFKPTTIPLTYNHRSTQILLQAADGFADSFAIRQTTITPSSECPPGELIQVHFAHNEKAEAVWIAKQIQKLAANNKAIAYNRIAVLARTNKRIERIGRVLEELGIPCITVEQFQFFMRQEVKDALAYLRLIVNPFDTGSFRRILLRTNCGIGAATIQNVIKEGDASGLRLTDMLFTDGLDPFGHLLDAIANGTIVVFDVESTGLNVSKDEVIEIAAVKLVKGKLVGEYRAFIANTVSVADSQAIHGYSDRFLKKHGQPAELVFEEFFNFAVDALLVGHNVGFDIKMVTACASKAGLKVPKFQWVDTWNLANRFIQSDSYSLENLAIKLNLTQSPTHKAIDDTRTTVELLNHLIPAIASSSPGRQALVKKYAKPFAAIAQQFNTWKDASQRLRPGDLLKKILLESGLYAHYKPDEKRRQNLLRLHKLFCERDNLELHPDTALRNLLEFTAIAKNLDQVSQQDNQVLMVTVHQSKGLEFDTVFLAGAVLGEFPAYFSVRDGKIEEEKRLFYVAMTRAKQRLYISAFVLDSDGYSKVPSKFINSIPKQFLING